MLLQRYFPLAKLAPSSGTGTTPGVDAVTFSRPEIYKYSPTSGGIATTVSVTATPNFGTGPYTYQWLVSGYITPDTPTSATTTFTATGSGAAIEFNEYKRCTVTDSLAVSQYNTILVDIQIGGLSK